MSGELEKLVIQSFSDLDHNNQVGEYIATINPDQISLESKIKYHTPQTPGNTGGTPQFERIEDPKLSLKLLIDGTGVIPLPTASKLSQATLKNVTTASTPDSHSLSSVNQQIKAFKEVAEKYEGENHETPKIRIAWGELIFKGKMESMKVNYVLFKPDGSPLRATVDAIFIGTVEVKERKKKANNQSPDLTHVRTVNEGDTLPLMCQRIYKNSKLYLRIAKVNGLSNYRNLEVGSKLFFPPIKD